MKSFGLAALEAMASGVPLVSSDAGGLPEINVAGETGYMRPVGDVQGMAEDAISILKDDDVLAQFKKNAYDAAQRFDISDIVPQYEAIYRHVLGLPAEKPEQSDVKAF